MNHGLLESLMVRKMLAASAVLLLVLGARAADEPDQVTGKFVKFDADKNEITVKVKKENMTYTVSKDVKVAVGEVKELKGLKADDMVTLTLKKDGDKTVVTEVKPATKGKGSPSPSPTGFADKGSSSSPSSSSSSGSSSSGSGTGSSSKGSSSGSKSSGSSSSTTFVDKGSSSSSSSSSGSGTGSSSGSSSSKGSGSSSSSGSSSK
jgi:uncharacterized membrane protein YgcG